MEWECKMGCPPAPFLPPEPAGGAIFNDVLFNDAVFNGIPTQGPPPPQPPPCVPVPPLNEPRFADMVAELVGTVPRMSALHAQQILQRSWRRIRDSRLW